MESFDKYKENLLSVADNKLLNISKSKEDNKKFKEAIIIDILSLEESRKDKKDFLPHDFFYSSLFNGFDEIIITFERLQDLESYIYHFPKTKASLAKINYLCFLIENHLNEIYILKERLVVYYKKIQDFYKGDCRHTSVKNKCQQLIDTVEDSFKNIKYYRHSHIHRFRYSDRDIKRLGTLSLHEEYLNELKKRSPTHIIPNFKTEYRKVRNKWKKIFKKNNKDIKIVLNDCFKEINTIIFPEDGEISYPKKHGSIKE
jgi:hypothetical protein